MSALSWKIQRSAFDDPQWQSAYGDDAIVKVSGGGRCSLHIAAAEVIEEVGPQFVLAHALQCVRDGVWNPEDVWAMAGEISALSFALKSQKRGNRK